MVNKVCCMFSDPVPGHAVDNRDLELIASDEWSRSEYRIYRCRKCGAYVYYQYVENTGYDWDNPGIDKDYIPIEEPLILNGQFPEKIAVIKGVPSLSARYLEEDYPRENWYYNR